MDKQLIDPGSSGDAGWHTLSNWLRCPRLARLEQESDEPREDSPALVKGSLVHLGLAHRYARLRAEQRGEDPDQFYEPHEAIAVGALRNAAEGSDLWHEFAPMAQEVVAAYERYWSVNQWRIVGVEQILRGEVDGFPYTQRADLIVQHQGRVFIVDHKTTGRIGNYAQERYILDGQFIGYEVLGEARWGAAWGGVILNFIGLEDGRFHRAPAEMKPGAIQTFRNTIRWGNQVRQMWEDVSPDLAPAVFTGAFGCNTPYPRGDGKRRCPFFERCQYGA